MRVENDGIRDWRLLLDRLAKAPHVLAASPAIYEQVLISRGARAKGAILKGILPERERRVSQLLNYVVAGSAQPLADAQQRHEAGQERQPQPSAGASPDSLAGVHARFEGLPPIILGKDMADDLGASVNSVVLVTSPQGELTPFGIVPKYMRFKVVGIFRSGFYDYDSAWAMTGLANSQRLFGLGDLVSVLEFKIDDIYKAGEVGDALQKEAGKGFMATNWMEQNRALFRALRLERFVTLITIGLIVFVAALNILISLIMMVMEKTKDIAVLVSMGAKRSQVRGIFILQGVLIGVIGTMIGQVVGYGLSWAAGHYHLIALSAEVYSIDYVPFAPRALDGLLVALVALGISLIATIYPSYSASRILPAEALRYE
jgi:lipoprotein-releasing system permease protein